MHLRNPSRNPTTKSSTSTNKAITHLQNWRTSQKTSTNDYPAFHLARKFSTKPFRHTRKRSMRAATNTSSQTTHSQNKKEIAKKLYGTTPPCNANVKTNLGRKFLNIIDRCFPNGHSLHKIFHKHTLKLTYSWMLNMKSIISSHNKALSSDYQPSQPQTNNKECNYRKQRSMPAGRKMPHTKCSLPSNSLNTNFIRIICRPHYKF